MYTYKIHEKHVYSMRRNLQVRSMYSVSNYQIELSLLMLTIITFLVAPMIMKFGAGIKLDVFYTMITESM